ncbi:zinc finger MYM-type protein 1-like [Cynara cardunculus var. scolymus]|uniref:zinc finger MYM-type protein 1-like n=1 Tax=Cynara cardunculus var. scolymus TaxID=59895 RepID=UPI000D6301DA|nr:zinc finger MYM-type protein 1-like [Cynara cardunculus var. scolymus]
MEKYLKRKASSSTGNNDASNNVIDVNDLPWDPSERPKIITYNPNQRDEIRRKYLVRGPCQPRGHIFPTKVIEDKGRRDQGGNHGIYAFVAEGFNSWSKKNRLTLHEGEVNSFHHKTLKKFKDLVNQNQSIVVAFRKQTELMKTEYHMRLNASVEVCRYLLENALPFRGNDESEKSMYKGLFLGTLKLIRRTNGEIEKVILQNAPKNNQLTSPKNQKDLVTCFGEEVLKGVIREIGDDVFALLVDESSDVSRKEQIAVVLRFVDKVGVVQERFVGIVHVMDTSAVSLKSVLDGLFAKHGLSFTKVRGQGYDGASNMSGKFNGLKALILSDNDSLQKKHEGIKDFFDLLALVVTVVKSSCKRKDMLRESHKERIQEEIGNNEIETGKRLNQEISFVRAGDTRWNSHLKTIVSLIVLFPEVIQVLEYVEDDGDNGAIRLQTRGLLSYLKAFEFVFYMHLISTILGLTNSLSQALQRKDEDILEAIDLIGTTKGQLQMLRENGFDQVLEKCYSFCDKHKIVKLDMTEAYVNTRNSRKRMNITNQHYYNYNIFNTVLDMQI